MSEQREITRRAVLKTGVTGGAAGLTTVAFAGPAQAFPGASDAIVLPRSRRLRPTSSAIRSSGSRSTPG